VLYTVKVDVVPLFGSIQKWVIHQGIFGAENNWYHAESLTNKVVFDTFRTCTGLLATPTSYLHNSQPYDPNHFGQRNIPMVMSGYSWGAGAARYWHDGRQDFTFSANSNNVAVACIPVWPAFLSVFVGNKEAVNALIRAGSNNTGGLSYRRVDYTGESSGQGNSWLGAKIYSRTPGTNSYPRGFAVGRTLVDRSFNFTDVDHGSRSSRIGAGLTAASAGSNTTANRRAISGQDATENVIFNENKTAGLTPTSDFSWVNQAQGGGSTNGVPVDDSTRNAENATMQLLEEKNVQGMMYANGGAMYSFPRAIPFHRDDTLCCIYRPMSSVPIAATTAAWDGLFTGNLTRCDFFVGHTRQGNTRGPSTQLIGQYVFESEWYTADTWDELLPFM